MRRYFIFFVLLGQKVLGFSTCLAAIFPSFSFDDCLVQVYQRQNFTEEQGFESIRSALQEAYATPLNLNTVTEEELLALGILSKEQIKNYFYHLATTGPLYSRYELQAIPDFDPVTIALLLPFIYVVESYTIPSPSLWKAIASSGNNYFLLRYEPSLYVTMPNTLAMLKPAGLPLGSLDKYMLQLSLKYNNDIAFGITSRKQAGESFCWDHATHRYGFNLWSIFFSVGGKKYFKQITIGDYQIGYGQGLLLSAGYTVKSRGDMRFIIRSNAIGIRPYRGIRRIGLRGVAITSNFGSVELTGFYAINYLDAKILLDNQNKPYANRIDQIGQYDKINNLNKKGTIYEQVVGCTIRKQYHKNQTEVGMNLLYHYYDTPIIPKTNFGQNLFQGQYLLSGSLFFRLLWKNIIWFGEGASSLPDAVVALNDYDNKALITGLVISLSRYLDFSSALYYYGKGFYNPYGSGFKNYTTDYGNEKGFYGAVTLTPLSNWTISTTSHFFYTLFPKPRLVVAGGGHRFTTRSSYILNRSTVFVVQHKLDKVPKNKPKKEWEAKEAEKIAIADKNSLKLRIDHKLTYAWWVNMELQYTYHTFLGQKNHGYALSNIQKWKGNRFQISVTTTYFKTQTYATRLYFYESTPLYSGTQFRPYYGNGVTTTWLACWKPNQAIRLELKYRLVYLFEDIVEKLEKKKNQDNAIKDKQVGVIQLILSF